MTDSEVFEETGRAIIDMVEDVEPSIAVSALAAVIVSMKASYFPTHEKARAALEDLIEGMREDLAAQFARIAAKEGHRH